MNPKDTIHPEEMGADDRGAPFKGKPGEFVTESNKAPLFDREDFSITANASPSPPQRLDEKTLEESSQSNDKVELEMDEYPKGLRLALITVRIRSTFPRREHFPDHRQ
jgi:hypothetical protein